MKAYYDSDMDYLEMIPQGVRNYAEDVDAVFTLFRKESDDTVVGFGLIKATKNMKKLVYLPLTMRLPAMLFLLRKIEGVTQAELAVKAQIGLRTIERVEAGEANISFGNLCRIMEAFPNHDFSLLLKAQDGPKSA